MSFLNDILDFAGGAIKWFSGDTVGANLARTAVSAYTLNRVQKGMQKETALPEPARISPVLNPIPDGGVRLQFSPDPENRVPVVYGRAQLSGIITDAELSNSNQTLWVVFTLCERTGVRLSDNAQSVISFENVFINDERVVFESDGQTVQYTVDRDGNINPNLKGLIRVRCYNNGSSGGVKPTGFSGAVDAAYTVMPSWSPLYTMNQLVFAVVEITYAPERGVQSVPTMRFELNNSMTLPGDCLYDYMTNTRYGAGIDPQEISSE